MSAKLFSWLRPWVRSAADLIYPLFCPGCESPMPGGEPDTLCAPCMAKLEPLERPFCERCAEPFPGDISGAFQCPNCRGRDYAFDFTACGWISAGPVREAIHAFKYQSRRHLRTVLGRLLLRALEDDRITPQTSWVITPVPLHPRRERERQFNQSAELARIVSARTGMEMIDGLRRTRFTSTQARLSRSERLRNLKGAFSMRPKVARKDLYRDRFVLLVDDVFTTGATAHECAAVLKKQGGARCVAAVAVARG